MGVIEAIQQGDFEALKSAISADPKSVNQSNDQGIPALLLALYFRRTDFVNRLLDAGALVDFHLACALNRSADAAAFLDSDPALLSARTPDGWTALHLAAFFGASETVRLLLDRGADALARSTNQMENLPLHAAAAARQSAIVEMLLDAGSPIGATQNGGYTAMDSAVQNKDEATVEVLVRRALH